MPSFLIVGLGNHGKQYENSRHNLGFIIIDNYMKEEKIKLKEKKFGLVAKINNGVDDVCFLKPNTYMNLSGNAVQYWKKKHTVENENMLVIVDDIALPIGKMRLRKEGSPGGHNGLKNIENMLHTQKYPRLKIGIGLDFFLGMQSEYVLGNWTKEQTEKINQILPTTKRVIDFFIKNGIENTIHPSF